MLTVEHPNLHVSNRSLTGNEAELLRRINVVAVQEKWTPKEYLTLCQSGIVGAFRSTDPAATDQRIPPLPDWAVERVAEISRGQVDAIGSSGARIVGEPDRLLVDGSPSPTAPPEAERDARPQQASPAARVKAVVTRVLDRYPALRRARERLRRS